MSAKWAIGGLVVRCDWNLCKQEFRSASAISVLPEQLTIAGWQLSMPILYGSPEDRLRTKHERIDLCPRHASEYRESWGRAAAARKNTRRMLPRRD